jgi:hypothetical protein
VSYELIAILVVGVTLGIGQAATIVIMVSGFGELVREMNRGFEEMTRQLNRGFEEMTRQLNRSFEDVNRTHRAIAGLVVQESEKIQALLRP